MAVDAFGNYICALDPESSPSVLPSGGTGTSASGTADPNTLTLSSGVLFYEQVDSGGAPVATWARKDSSSTWYITVQNQ